VKAALATLAFVACHGTSEPERAAPQTIRCAVIGGMMETGFWQQLAKRYELVSGNTIELAATGPKPIVVDAFKKGGIDLITVHASDAMVNLVADGLAVDPQPWVKNDLVIVGPADDPAHVRGGHDAVAALRAIIAVNAPVLVHASMGADGVLHDLVDSAHLVFGKDEVVVFDGENQHQVLDRAAQLHAYTLVGRIPVLDGKLHHDGIELMVRGDPALRRPYLVEVAAGASPRIAAAKDFAAYLRAPETQAWIATFGKGKYDADPLFFPIASH
jgi:tungstate transport system substrate-binding protein